MRRVATATRRTVEETMKRMKTKKTVAIRELHCGTTGRKITKTRSTKKMKMRRGENDFAEALGKTAFYLGLLLNLGFVAVRRARFLVNVPPGLQRLALELHMDGNMVLTVPALCHGFTFIDKAGPVEYGAVALILLLAISGAVMRYYRNRRAKLVARMIHSQRALALLLLVLLLIHVSGGED